MGKKSKKDEPKLSKKERKRLAEAEAKAARKVEKKGKGKKAKPDKIDEVAAAQIDADGTREAAVKRATEIAEQIAETPDESPMVMPPERIIAAADKVLADQAAPADVHDKARKARNRALATLDDEGMRERVQSKAAERAALEEERESVDRADEAAVADFNARLMALGGGALITSDAERERAGSTDASVEIAQAEVIVVDRATETRTAEAEVVEPETEQVDPKVAAARAALDATFVKPSEALDIKPTFEENGNGQYKVKRLADGKVVGYTRVTTYIDALEYKGQLEAWKLRVLLEGAAIAETPEGGDEHVLATIRDLAHVRDVAIVKAHKRDRKGKLAPGELAHAVQTAQNAFKKATDDLAQRLLDIGGAHAKAEKGTNLHALCEVYDAEGIGAIEAMVERGDATPSDLADVHAYAEAVQKAGLRVLDAEVQIVNDDLKVAGRLDRLVMYKPEGATRASKVVADIKTGRVDYGRAKIAQQIALYATGLRYDSEKHERSPLGASKKIGLLIHLPAGSATCSIFEVDLTTGARGNKLAGEVRAWRRDGQHAIDLKAPLVSIGGAS